MTNFLIIFIGIFSLSFALVVFVYEKNIRIISFEDYAKMRGLKISSFEKDLNKSEIVVKFEIDPHRLSEFHFKPIDYYGNR